MSFQGDPLDPRIGVATLLGGQEILQSQYDILLTTLPESPVDLLGIFGAWRGGKTTAEMLIALIFGIQNPWTPAYGGNRPCTLMITETATVMRDSLYAAMTEVFPEGVIVREVKQPAWDIEIPNGHVFALRTDRGAMEGKTVCNTIVDEVHKVKSKRNYLNYSARASDKRGAKNMTVVAGLPIDNGWLREEFDRKDDDPRRKTFYLRTADNIHLPPGYVEKLRSSCSPREAKTLIEAEWHVYDGAIYDEFDVTKHFVSDPGDPHAPVHIGLDAGHQAAVIVAQDRRRPLIAADARGLHVVDELYPDAVSVEHAMREVIKRGWQLVPGISYVCVDPKMDDDQLESIRRVLREYGRQGVAIVQYTRGELQESVAYGIRCVQTALLDANRNVRLTFSKELTDHDRGLRRGLVRYRWNPRTRQPVKDDKIDHGLDGLRYIVAHRLPSDGARRATEIDDFTIAAGR